MTWLLLKKVPIYVSLHDICKQAPLDRRSLFSFLGYALTHDAVPSAVSMAVATDAMICTMNFSVSFLLIVH